MTPVWIIDIALTSSSSEGARNDFVRFYDEEEDYKPGSCLDNG
jgi:hypothetical protein